MIRSLSNAGRPVLAALAVCVLGACRGQTSAEPPIVPFRGMHEMPKYDTQEASPYFADGRSMREPVDGTIPREAIIDPILAEGVDDSGAYVLTVPDAIVSQAGGMAALVERGRSRYDIYCSACHAYTGDGRGMITQRAEAIGATFAAADLHDARLRQVPDGHLFAAISNGVRTMPAYRATVPVADRWAIVAYVRALQLSQSENAR